MFNEQGSAHHKKKAEKEAYESTKLVENTATKWFVFMTELAKHINSPSPKKSFIADLHESQKCHILHSKRRISKFQKLQNE